MESSLCGLYLLFRQDWKNKILTYLMNRWVHRSKAPIRSTVGYVNGSKRVAKKKSLDIFERRLSSECNILSKVMVFEYSGGLETLNSMRFEPMTSWLWDMHSSTLYHHCPFFYLAPSSTSTDMVNTLVQLEWSLLKLPVSFGIQCTTQSGTIWVIASPQKNPPLN